jgi:hypothetical protein
MGSARNSKPRCCEPRQATNAYDRGAIAASADAARSFRDGIAVDDIYAAGDDCGMIVSGVDHPHVMHSLNALAAARDNFLTDMAPFARRSTYGSGQQRFVAFAQARPSYRYSSDMSLAPLRFDIALRTKRA